MTSPPQLAGAIVGAVRAYIRLAGLVKDRFGRDLPGLGWSARRISRRGLLDVRGRRMVFEPKLAGAYGRLIAGDWNEQETHPFLCRMADAVERGTFIDVGASVGEMVIDLATHPNVSAVLAFEPNPDAVEICRESVRLNGWSHVTVHELALGAEESTAVLRVADHSPTGGRLVDREEGGPMVRVSTMDREAASVTGPCLILIDTEGWEAEVLRGASALIARTRPLIVFEYNEVSRRHFHVNDIRQLLGDGYDIYRLRIDGALDRRYDRAWNCVAIPAHGPFAAAAAPLIDSDD